MVVDMVPAHRSVRVRRLASSRHLDHPSSTSLDRVNLVGSLLW